MSFSETWERVKLKTEIRTFTELANLVGTTSQYVSRKKKEDDFPVVWAFDIARKYGLSTDWIMTGEELKGPTTVRKERKLEILADVEEWLEEIVKKEPYRKEWFQAEMEDKFPAFKAWKERKDGKIEGGEIAPISKVA